MKKLYIRYIVAFLALLQLISPTFISFDEDGIGTEALITPADYAFAIWGPIVILCAVYAVYQLLPGQGKNKFFDELNKPLVLVFTGFTVWLYAAGREWLWITLAVFIGMWLALLKGYNHFLKNKSQLEHSGKNIVYSMLGLYLGWSTIAIFANLTSALRFENSISPTESSLFTYTVILVAATINALVIQYFVKTNWFYTGTIIWAFIAVAVGAGEKGSQIVQVLSVMASIIVLGYAVKLRAFSKLS